MKRIHPMWWVLLVFIILLCLSACTSGLTAPPYMDCFVDPDAGIFYCVVDGDTIRGAGGAA